MNEGRDGDVWVHPLVAHDLARWCAPRHAVQTYVWLDEFYRTGSLRWSRECIEASLVAHLGAEGSVLAGFARNRGGSGRATPVRRHPILGARRWKTPPPRPGAGYVNATRICQATGKRWEDYRRQPEVDELLEAIRKTLREILGISPASLIETRPDGVWVHPLLAHDLARWCAPRFAVQTYQWLDEFYRTGELNKDRRAIEALLVEHLGAEAAALAGSGSRPTIAP